MRDLAHSVSVGRHQDLRVQSTQRRRRAAGILRSAFAL